MLALMFVLFGIQGAQAATLGDVTCHRGGCLETGMTYYDYVSGRTFITECAEGGCEKSGWTDYSSDGRDTYVIECHGLGCFVDGWTAYDRYTWREAASVQCFGSKSGERDCFKYGWSTFAKGTSWLTQCFGSDCRTNGWHLRTQAGHVQRAICKQKDCFNKGWILDQN